MKLNNECLFLPEHPSYSTRKILINPENYVLMIQRTINFPRNIIKILFLQIRITDKSR